MKRYVIIAVMIITIMVTTIPAIAVDPGEFPPIPAEVSGNYVYLASRAPNEWNHEFYIIEAPSDAKVTFIYEGGGPIWRVICDKAYKRYIYIDDSWTSNSYGANQESSKLQLPYNTFDFIIGHSDFDLYNENGTVFFSPPLPALTQALRQVNNQTPLKTLLAGGVGSLIPLLIGLIVGAVGLRKAWVFLKTGLKKA